MFNIFSTHNSTLSYLPFVVFALLSLSSTGQETDQAETDTGKSTKMFFPIETSLLSCIFGLLVESSLFGVVSPHSMHTLYITIHARVAVWT